MSDGFSDRTAGVRGGVHPSRLAGCRVSAAQPESRGIAEQPPPREVAAPRPATGAGEITVVLREIAAGDERAADRLLPLVYEQLRHLAAMRMAREAAGQTLQPTALVHEAWLRLGGDCQPDWKSRAQFFAAAAESMRRILIDRARRRLALRRGGRQVRLNLDEVELAAAADDDRALAVHDALEKFAADHPQKAELVKLRFFAGLTLEEVALALGLSSSTAGRWWAYARAWLIHEIKHEKP